MENNLNEKQKNIRIILNMNFEVNKSFITNSSTNGENIYYCQDIIGKKLIYDKDKQTDIDEKSRMLFRARKSKNNYYELIYPIVKLSYKDYEEISKLDNRLWYYNKNGNENEEYNLLENDIIKFGNAKFEIIKKHISNSSTEHNNQINNVNHKFGSIFDEFIPEKSNENDTCFFCKDRKLSKEISKVKLCKCDNYAHYECCKEEIKKLYKTKKSDKGNVIRYMWGGFGFCECEAPKPSKFFFNFDEEILKNSDYIILESLN